MMSNYELNITRGVTERFYDLTAMLYTNMPFQWKPPSSAAQQLQTYSSQNRITKPESTSKPSEIGVSSLGKVCMCVCVCVCVNSISTNHALCIQRENNVQNLFSTLRQCKGSSQTECSKHRFVRKPSPNMRRKKQQQQQQHLDLRVPQSRVSPLV